MKQQEHVVTVVGTLIFYIGYFYLASGSNEFAAITERCSCEGYDQVYECRVTGSGATVWKGSAFDCSTSSNEIALLHRSSNEQRSLICNNGAIVGRLIRAESNTYVSQLTISVNGEMIGKNISCCHDSNGRNNLIGSSLLTITTDPYPPPSDVHLVDVNSTHLIFQWNPVSSNCNAIQYRITASNCGHCPNITNSTTVTCTGPFTNGQPCIFSIRTVVCDNTVGNESRRVQVALRTPSAPVVNVIPTYSHKTKRLIALTTRFDELEPSNISDGVDGSTTSYTITYTESTTGVACASATVLASSCMNKTCEHKLELPSSPQCSNSAGISVTVSGTNRLGNGLLSAPVSTPGVTTQFVDLSFDPSSKIATCLFLHQPKAANEKTCRIVYGLPGKTCKMFLHQSSKSLSDKVYIGFPETNHLQSQKEYCFTVTASNGTFTTMMEGSMLTTTGTSSASTSRLSAFTIGVVPFGASLGAMALLIIIITATFILITVILVRSRRVLRKDLERLKTKTIEQPPIYEELDCVAPTAAKPASPPTIDIGQNTAYLSLSGLFSNAILS